MPAQRNAGSGAAQNKALKSLTTLLRGLRYASGRQTGNGCGCVTLPHAREGTLHHFRSGCPVWILECLKEQWDEDKNMDTAAGGLVRRGAKGSHAIEHSGNESDCQRECGIR